MCEQAQEGRADAAHRWFDSLARAFSDNSNRRAIRHHDQAIAPRKWRHAVPRKLTNPRESFDLAHAVLPSRPRGGPSRTIRYITRDLTRIALPANRSQATWGTVLSDS